MELLDAQVAQVRIGLVAEDAGRDRTGVPPSVATDWGYLAELRTAADAPPPPPPPPRSG